MAAMGTTANSFALSVPVTMAPRTLSINSDNNTVYQGIGNFSALAVGTFVNLDGAIQLDGSVLSSNASQ